MVTRRGKYKPRWSTPIPAENVGTVTAVHAKSRYSDKLIAETKAVWQPYYAAPLSDEDAREIVENMIEFMRLLSTLKKHRANRAEPSRKSR